MALAGYEWIDGWAFALIFALDLLHIDMSTKIELYHYSNDSRQQKADSDERATFVMSEPCGTRYGCNLNRNVELHVHFEHRLSKGRKYFDS